jgi:ATP-binding cassette subfamily F protein uup
LEQLEKDMALLEEEKKELNEKLNSGTGGNDELTQWGKRYQEVIDLLDEKSFRWLELSEQM